MGIEEHLFRREAGRMIATLARIFGVHNLELAEDVVQDAFCRALEVFDWVGVVFSLCVLPNTLGLQL
ncbi:MAG TPA: hypothetical protein VE994_09220 [Terriglobales bacterium]|jgi:RNA polymerase sigma-70 factor (ECF subfamily)|nr:hypothetical protein [Terriglobales bacterium]